MSVSEMLWRQAILPLQSTINDAINCLEKVGIKIVLVIDEDGKTLLGTISDGDIRRGLLKGLQMNSSISNVLHSHPLVAPLEMSRELVLQLMVANKIQQIPIVNEERALVGLHLWDDINAIPVRSNLMVIMAGGLGKRLFPHTENCPKPLLPIEGKPMLEHIISRAKSEGFNQFCISIRYLGHMIEDYFGDGSRFGIRINYLREENPLGTAGALSLLNPRPDLPFIVTNGDVITDIRYGELLDFHALNNSMATMAVSVYEWQHPYGVVSTKGIDIIGFEEKPVTRSHINAGVYVLDPAALNLMHSNNYCDMPQLFELVGTRGMRTIAYPMHEPWLDVGRHDDLNKALRVMKDGVGQND